MNNYNYELNALFNNDIYSELLEIYNNYSVDNILNESTMPANKLKDMLKKISSIKNDKQMETFVGRHKNFVKPEKELNSKVYKLANDMDIDLKAVKKASVNISRAFAALGQASVLTMSGAIIPILIVMMINSKIKKQPFKQVSEQVLKDIEKSITSTTKGPYSSSLNFTVYGVLSFIGGFMTYLIGALFGGSVVALGMTGGFLLVAGVLLVLSTISFMWTFLGTPGRMKEGE
jgi:hypothetical protein